MTGRDDSAEKATRDFNAMVGEGYLAVIHADGNGLGQMLMTLGNYLQEHPGIAAEVYPLISRIIEETNVGAVRKAFATVVAGKHESGNVLPLRPIVLDGDDLTLAARADLAVDFVAAYLQAFEELSARQLQAAKSTGPLRKIDGLPERLTACAGIAFVKSTYPFSKGYELAEGLCTFAKKSAKALKTEGGYDIASCLAFHRLTCSTSDDYADIQQADLSVAMQPGENLRLWAGPYAVGHYATGAHRKPLAPLTDLKVLSKALRSMPRGSMRGLVQTLTLNPVQAKIDFVRVRQVAKDKGAWAALAAGLKPFVGGEESELWNPAGHTPLLDALALNLMTTGGEDEAADA